LDSAFGSGDAASGKMISPPGRFTGSANHSESNCLKLTWEIGTGPQAPSTGFALQEADQPTPTGSWTNSTLAVMTNNNQNTVSVDVTNAAKFFRLRLN
jgi:hypothetical protein